MHHMHDALTWYPSTPPTLAETTVVETPPVIGHVVAAPTNVEEGEVVIQAIRAKMATETLIGMIPQ